MVAVSHLDQIKWFHSIIVSKRLVSSAIRSLDTTATAKSTATFAATVFAVATPEGGASSCELVFLAITHIGTASGLLVRGGDNFGGKGQVLSEIVDSLVRQVAVVVLPRESNANVSTRLERLHQHENLQVGGAFNVRMGLGTGVLLDDANALLKEVAENSDTVLLWDVHGSKMLVVFWALQTRKPVGMIVRMGVPGQTGCRSTGKTTVAVKDMNKYEGKR